MYGLIAYGWWGLVLIYFKAVAHVPPLAVLAHRVVWSPREGGEVEPSPAMPLPE